jgi:CheY-like chemotaxis protein
VAPRIINLNESIGAMQQMLRRLIGEDIALTWAPGEALWPTRIDPAQVDQILANLCVNARDAIRDVGRIVIETGNATLDEEYCRNRPGHRPGDYVVIAVSDNGDGMDAETRAHVFEPFFTTKEVGKGTGLGLATVYGIVQQNNGFIHVYSEPGEGTTFRIYLPRLATADAGGPVAVVRGEAPRGAGETVLVVEDESMILEVAVEILEGLGYKVLSTTAPAEAVAIASEHKGTIDLLLTDVIMPGMNGRDLAGRVRALRPGLRVLYMSGYTANVIVTRGLVDQGDAFVQKPFSTDELAARVRALLDAAG